MNLSTMKYPDLVALSELTWLKGFNSVPQRAKTSGLFRTLSIPDHTGNTREFTEMDNELFLKRKGESELAKRIEDVQGFKKIGKLIRFAGEKEISWELRKHNKYTEVISRLINLGKQGPQTIERDLCHVITFGAAGGYVDADGETRDLKTADGENFFDTAHKMKATGKTFSNILAGAPQFSENAFELMLQLRRENAMNHFGQIVATDDDIIFTTSDPKTVHAVSRYLLATTQVGQANPGVPNVLPKYKHVVLEYLDTDANGGRDASKSKWWGVASSSNSEVYYAETEAPHIKLPGVNADGTIAEDFSTDDIKVGARAEYMIVTVAPYGHAISMAN